MTMQAWEAKAEAIFTEARAGKLSSDDVIANMMELDEQFDNEKPFRKVKRLECLAGPELDPPDPWGV